MIYAMISYYYLFIIKKRYYPDFFVLTDRQVEWNHDYVRNEIILITASSVFFILDITFDYHTIPNGSQASSALFTPSS
jgi:hypothetical protein